MDIINLQYWQLSLYAALFTWRTAQVGQEQSNWMWSCLSDRPLKITDYLEGQAERVCIRPRTKIQLRSKVFDATGHQFSRTDYWTRRRSREKLHANGRRITVNGDQIPRAATPPPELMAVAGAQRRQASSCQPAPYLEDGHMVTLR